jgi:hypothetical protein
MEGTNIWVQLIRKGAKSFLLAALHEAARVAGIVGTALSQRLVKGPGNLQLLEQLCLQRIPNTP